MIWWGKSVPLWKKTPGYHRDIFRAPNLWKMVLKGWKRYFWKKKTFHQFFYIFQILKFSDFLQNVILSGNKTFYKNIIWYALYSKFPMIWWRKISISESSGIRTFSLNSKRKKSSYVIRKGFTSLIKFFISIFKTFFYNQIWKTREEFYMWSLF